MSGFDDPPRSEHDKEMARQSAETARTEAAVARATEPLKERIIHLERELSGKEEGSLEPVGKLNKLMDSLRLDLVRRQPAILSPQTVVAVLEEMQHQINQLKPNLSTRTH